MQIKVELSEADIKEALVCYINRRVEIEGYRATDVSFIYDEDGNDYHSSLEGAFVTLESELPRLLPCQSEAA